MLATLAALAAMSCATVNPLTNQVDIHGPSFGYSMRYEDHGDHIAYPSRVPAYVRVLVEGHKGTSLRRGCGRHGRTMLPNEWR